MFVRGITLSLPALLALCVMAESALADHNRRPRQVIIEDQYSDAPPFIRHIPGLRIFFGDYALTEEEYDQLYGTGRRVYRDDDRDILDEEDDPPPPRRKATQKEQQKPVKKKTVSKPATEEKKAPAKTAAAASGLSCEKATSVVSGYGFSSVTPSSCSGKVYAFNAQRDGKSFAIKLDPKSGELTEVKKLP